MSFIKVQNGFAIKNFIRHGRQQLHIVIVANGTPFDSTHIIACIVSYFLFALPSNLKNN
jgi:hypothetical protein